MKIASIGRLSTLTEVQDSRIYINSYGMRLHGSFFNSIFYVLLFFTNITVSESQGLTAALKNGGAYVETEQGKVLFDHRTDERFIPASTIKVATAAAAMHILGDSYRFNTKFYRMPNGCLGIFGGGDPSLTSRALEAIAPHISAKVKRIPCILIDNSYFQVSTAMDGRSATSNPYDALNSAFLVNFNTVAVKVLGAGIVLSGEPETPLTEVGRKRAKSLGKGDHRVNLGTSVEEGGRNGAQILAHFLKKYKTTVAAPVVFGRIPSNSELLYTHHSSMTLSEIVAAMLNHSTNVTANQIFLVMGAQKFGAPATLEKGRRALSSFLASEVGWRNVTIEEGSGLSRSTKVTPREMVALLRWFSPYRELLPIEEQSRVKTGTINGVNTLVGYSTLANGTSIRFAILVNSQVPFDYKFKVLRIMRQELSKQ